MIVNETTNRFVSPYENDLRKIFNEKNQSRIALISSWESLSSADRTILKKIKGNWRWLDLLLKDYIPSIPLWSNLIYSISSNVRPVRWMKSILQLTHSKEKRMSQIKQIQSDERNQCKTDFILENLAKDLHRSISICFSST